MPPKSKYKEGEERLVAIVGDEDTVTGFLLAGAGDSSVRKGRGPNYLVVHKTTPLPEIEEGFRAIMHRPDIGIVLICQHIANDIRHVIAEYTDALPCVMEIPSKDQPYDQDKDVVLQKINRSLGVK
jgi:V-type H+-transporting ATPase subunit F